jgi:hypothetical protein
VQPAGINPAARSPLRRWKVGLLKGLYQRGLDQTAIRQLFRLLDWMMDLPAELQQDLWQELAQFEEEKKMPYVTSVERIGFERGKAEGKAEWLVQILELRCKTAVPAELVTQLRAVNDTAKLDQWLDVALQANSLEAFRQAAGI